MTIERFLAGAPPGAAPPGAPWRVDHRHAEGTSWRPLGWWGEARIARDEAASPVVDLARGDLVRVVGPAGVTAGCWVRTARELADAGRVGDAQTCDWVEAWEGKGARADEMLTLARTVDRRRLVLAACDCAGAGLAEIPAPADERNDSRRVAVRALEVGRRWALGLATAEEVYGAASGAYRRAETLEEEGQPWALAVDAAASAVWAATEPGNVYAAIGSASDSVGRRRSLGALVRQWIPLSEVLLARAGDPTPLSAAELARVPR